ncbi:discoidin, CUB and LCCL domain-containing protein 1-like [Eublepharis macularius]|uniref:Discoidin, CUB and LCCL domain-containing protein 1-like n=1 Tax=Eublepharis macularius TaxID=481883 RepID=A0AA97KH95_EUBMA|nr:discoidin, CUB and LCCL domain-containing protein 1-like [Eublepharis macularius]
MSLRLAPAPSPGAEPPRPRAQSRFFGRLFHNRAASRGRARGAGGASARGRLGRRSQSGRGDGRWAGGGAAGRERVSCAGLPRAPSRMRRGLGAPALLLLLGPLRFCPAGGQTGDGCGPSVLRPNSGTLASKNYPGTYPNFTSCEWRIHVAIGSYLTLVFGDMDIEASEQCKSGFLLLSFNSSSYGPYCSNSNPPRKVLVVNTSSVTILFNSTVHRSGRGFLLSYASGNQPDLISCLQKGIHYSKEQIRAYCPAGCKEVTGDIWGNVKQGYRDTSVLCKAAVHAGLVLDEQGGQVTLSQAKGITLYESSFANGLYSKRGPLSEKRLIFHKACDGVLEASGFHASSFWHEQNAMGENQAWAAEHAAFNGGGISWAADQSSTEEWLEVDLGGKRNITGIITKGSSHKYNYYIKSYQVLFSRDGKNWKVYKSIDGEDKVFEGNSDSHQEVSNTFIPPILARYLRITPQSWNQRIALKVELLGCQVARIKAMRPYSDNGIRSSPKELPVLTSRPAVFTPNPGIVINSEKTGPPVLVMLLIGGFVLFSSALLLLVFLCLKKRKTAVDQDCGLIKVCPTSEASQICSRHSLQLSASEVASFPGAGASADLDGVPSPEYAEPDVVQVSSTSQTVPSTFKPDPDEGYTLPLVVNHYDVPGKYHEYAEPLPPEPEYATPFVEQPTEPEGAAFRKNFCIIKVIPSSQSQPGSLRLPGCPEPQMQYDFPAPRPAEKPDGAAGEGSVLEGSATATPREQQGGWTLSTRGEPPATQPAASLQGHPIQLRDSPLAYVYHESL